MKIVCVASARPNFMKIAPIVEAFRAYPDLEVYLTHTGQHYDDAMSGVFFRELGLPPPDVVLETHADTQVSQIAKIMQSFEQVCLRLSPDLVVVVGDVNGTLACALTAAKLDIRLAHVEAGLRSFDRAMPEETNRIVVDSLSDILFCTERGALENLRREGVPEDKIFFVGNVMIDSLIKSLPRAKRSTILTDLGVEPQRYAVATLHRPAAVDDPQALAEILDAFDAICRDLPILFPVHPRTRKNLEKFGLLSRMETSQGIRLLPPLGYFEFLALNSSARVVFTDSGGVQEETTVLGVPCVTIRENTERPVTCEVGGNRLAGMSKSGILDAYAQFKNGNTGPIGVPELWDGKAAKRIAKLVVEHMK